MYNSALTEKTEGIPRAKAVAYTAEGRLLALELMGYLVSFYQNRAFGIGPTRSERTTEEGGGEEDLNE